jgi:hypothetical protein
MPEHPKVFISYSHQNVDYEKTILQFSNKLRAEGIDATIDLYEQAPVEGWPRWMENQINNADYVLVVCCKSYYDKCYSDNKSKGISWEINIVYQHIYDSTSQNTKFIPIIFEEADGKFILTPIKSFTYYNVGQAEGYDKLYWRLRGINQTQKPPLGNYRPLPLKQQKSMFFASPIDIEKWNRAGWKGVMYLFYPGRPPVLGLLYKNYPVAKEIFSEWIKHSEDEYADKFIKVDFIVSPFPDECWVYSSKDKNYGRGYFVHIGANIDETLNRAVTAGLKPEELLLTTVSRYQWMDENSGSQYREMFKKLTSNKNGYFLMPIGIRNELKAIAEDNLIIDSAFAIKMKNVTFKSGNRIEENDFCKIVLKKSEKP